MIEKMHFLLSSMSVMYVLTTPIHEDGGDDATVEQIRKKAKWDNDDYVCRGLILNGMSDSLFDIYLHIYHNVEYFKELWDSLEAKYIGGDVSNKKSLVSLTNSLLLEKISSTGPSVVNMVEHNNSSRYNDNKGKRKHHDTRANPKKKQKVTCWKYGKREHLKKDCKAGNVGNRANGSSTKGSEDGSSNPLKGQSMFNKSY
ncbi:hypothetical protein Tco_1171536 [Tanacetum coccineum]